MTTDKTQKLDEALIALAWEVDAAAAGYQKNRSKSKSIADLYGDGISEAKQALLDWHNKQLEEALAKFHLKKGVKYDVKASDSVIVITLANKLKDGKND